MWGTSDAVQPRRSDACWERSTMDPLFFILIIAALVISGIGVSFAR
jgi:hypothetical protein